MSGLYCSEDGWVRIDNWVDNCQQAQTNSEEQPTQSQSNSGYTASRQDFSEPRKTESYDEEIIPTSSPARSSHTDRRNPRENRSSVRSDHLQVTLASRPRSTPQTRNEIQRQPPRTTTDWRNWRPAPPPSARFQPSFQQPARQLDGHSYGPVVARGNSTIVMGNIGSSNNARCHAYGPVFTGGQAQVYIGDVSSEEAERIFRRS